MKRRAITTIIAAATFANLPGQFFASLPAMERGYINLSGGSMFFDHAPGSGFACQVF